MWIINIFLKGKRVLVRMEIIHKSKFLPGTVEKNSSTIRSSGRNRTYACAACIISTRTKTHLPFRKINCYSLLRRRLYFACGPAENATQRRSQDFRPRGATKNVEGANFCGHDWTHYYNKQIPFL